EILTREWYIAIQTFFLISNTRSASVQTKAAKACISLILVIVLWQRRSTLFPYTTLFRSLCHALPDLRKLDEVLCILRFNRLRDLDRKSTRLNSSHRTISYAVFCLKKKTSSLAGGSYSTFETRQIIYIIFV